MEGLNEISESGRKYIYAAVYCAYNASYQCHQCTKRMSKEIRDARRACTKDADKPVHAFEGLEFFKCPGNYNLPGWSSILDLVRQYKQGTLPCLGGLLDQPAWYIDAITYADHLINIEEAKRWQTMKSKSKSR